MALNNSKFEVHKNIQIILEFLKAPFLVQHFSYYTWMTLMMLSVVLPSMLMILLSTISMIWHLIWVNNFSWHLNLNLIYETVDLGRKLFVDFNARKTNLVLFDQSNKLGAIDVKVDWSLLEEKPSLRMLGLFFISKFDIISIVKTASLKIGALICSMKFLSPNVILYLYKFIIQPCIEYCPHTSSGALICYLEMFD